MTIFGWIIFALINIIILFSLDHDPSKGGTLEGLILGMTGALSGSLFAYLIVKGVTSEFTITFFLVLVMEFFLMMVLFFGKTLKKIKI